MINKLMNIYFHTHLKVFHDLKRNYNFVCKHFVLLIMARFN